MTPTKKPKLLLIDDQIEDLKGLFLKYFTKKFDIHFEGNANKAIDKIKMCAPDIVLLDIDFNNNWKGGETLRAIKNLNQDLPVMMFTNNMAEDRYDFNDYSDADFCFYKKELKNGEKGFDYLSEQIIEIINKSKEKYNFYNYFSDILKEEIGFQFGNNLSMVEEIKKIARIIETMPNVAPSPILITGETGTGKDLIACAIHKASTRRDHQLVTVNCGAMTDTLIESQLFGHTKGAFTGAMHERQGSFASAQKGILFLDEIGEVPLALQARFLRAIENGRIQRLGEDNERSVYDVLVVAATNRNLVEEIATKNFREDLYYRLGRVSINLPPLKDRKEDIPLIFKHCVRKWNNKFGKRIDPSRLRNDVEKLLKEYHWPGNVREFDGCIEDAVLSTKGMVLQLDDFPKLQNFVKPRKNICCDESGKINYLPQNQRTATDPVTEFVSYVVDLSFEGKLKWEDFRNEFKNGSGLSRRICLGWVERFRYANKREPTQNELAGIFQSEDSDFARFANVVRNTLSHNDAYLKQNGQAAQKNQYKHLYGIIKKKM